MTRLFIAEKPSMAKEIAKCLPGPLVSKDGYYETGDGRVTWSFGHILQQANPEDYNERYAKWIAADLPIIPPEWKLLITESSKKQFKIIKNLISQASEIVHAGDPDREGQLLIDEILEYEDLEYVKNQKPVHRLILNALDEKTITRALKNIKDNKDYYTLKQSALARSRADWSIGMNLSRAFTIAAQKAGHEVTLPIGRVKTPTISLVVRRENEIKNFTPVNYYILKANFHHQNGTFQAIWQPKDTQSGLDPEGRLLDRAIVANLIQQFENEEQSPIIADCEKTQKKEANRLPYSLSALQIEAGRKFGYDPQTVLDTAQKLYEKKLTTYPRSDCDFLPENQFEDGINILANLKEIAQSEISQWAIEADTTIKSRAWNDKKITAHHAIIPTEVKCDYATLSEEERNLYYLISQAYIAQFYPNHVYNHTKITVDFTDEIFTVSGKTIIEDGWRILFRKSKEDNSNDNKDENDEAKELPLVKKADEVKYIAGEILDKRTKPLTRFTSSTLLEAMKEIHKYVKNEELKKQLKDVSGIGTEATRATIIKEIMIKEFLIEEKKHLVPTDKAYFLVSLLPDELTYPDNTAEWEMTFEKMVDGTVKLSDFMEDQKEFVTILCEKAMQMKIKQAPGITCPVCHKSNLKRRPGKNGFFWACNAYPECKTTYNDEKGKPQFNKQSAKKSRF